MSFDALATAAPCVHCGFCLPACPTYDLLGTELDSPRGRLMLMERLADGRLEPSPSVLRHLDLCLGCRACETACPSGVPYGEHLEASRAAHRNHPAREAGVRRLERLALAGVALPGVLQRAGARTLKLLGKLGLLRLAGRVLSGRLGAAAQLLDAAQPQTGMPPRFTPAAVPRADGRRPRVALLTGCVGSALFAQVNQAAVQLLSQAGCDVLVPREQGCCGALHAHAGDTPGALGLLRRNLAAFHAAGPVDAVIVTAAGCGSALKSCGSWARSDSTLLHQAQAFAVQVTDALELLTDLGLPPAAQPLALKLACHDACHLAHAQRLPGLGASLLDAIPGLERVPLTESDRCCGSAGIYNLLQPGPAAALGAAKLKRLHESGATVLTAANPGCLLHLRSVALRAGSDVQCLHPLELLARSLAPRLPVTAGLKTPV